MKNWIRRKLREFLGYEIVKCLEPGKIYIVQLKVPFNQDEMKQLTDFLETAKKKLDLKFIIVDYNAVIAGPIKNG